MCMECEAPSPYVLGCMDVMVDFNDKAPDTSGL